MPKKKKQQPQEKKVRPSGCTSRKGWTWYAGNESKLKAVLEEVHKKVLSNPNNHISLENLQIVREKVKDVDVPYGIYFCHKLLNGRAHGIVKRRVSVLKKPGGLTCDICGILTNVLASKEEVKKQLTALMAKKWHAQLRARVDLSELDQFCSHREGLQQPGLYITYVCRNTGTDGEPHGVQTIRQAAALRLEFTCKKCDEEKTMNMSLLNNVCDDLPQEMALDWPPTPTQDMIPRLEFSSLEQQPAFYQEVQTPEPLIPVAAGVSVEECYDTLERVPDPCNVYLS